MAEPDDLWRTLVNNYKGEDLPEDGLKAPEAENLPKLPKGTTNAKQTLYVQKVVTEVYIYTDLANQAYGSQTFQTSYPLGEMTAQKLMNLLNKEIRKRNK